MNSCCAQRVRESIDGRVPLADRWASSEML
jgi:hypothetical protein